MALYFRTSVPNLDNWRFWIKKTNALIDLINEQDNIDKIYFYAKDLSKPKYEFLIKKQENAGTKNLNDLNAFIEY